jgi:hypothetical protein
MVVSQNFSSSEFSAFSESARAGQPEWRRQTKLPV